MTQPNRNLIIDSSGVLHRCFHGYPPRQGMLNGERVEISALRGYMEYTRNLAREFDCERVIHVLDSEGGSAWRKQAYPAYKANRSEKDPGFLAQEKMLPAVLDACGQAWAQIEGQESDDIIAALVEMGRKQGDISMVVTQDKDLMQLVDDSHCCLVRYVKRQDGAGNIHQVFGEAEVMETFGVRADQVADYLAITGDATDNIPGVHKAGPKTARDWLNTHGNLASLITNADSIKGKTGDNLRASIEQLKLFQYLTLVMRDIEGLQMPQARCCSLDECLPLRQCLQIVGHEWEEHFPLPTGGEPRSRGAAPF